MLHILGTIIIGFIAGVIAKLVTPGDREPKGFILTTILASLARSWRRTSGRRSAGMDPIKMPDLSVPSWAP
jgi:hypothetical protein